jgi:RHS repeat-associated protein
MTRRIHNRSLREDEIQNHPMLAHPSSLLLPCAYRMQNLRARPYDPRTGRFVGKDPFHGNMQDPQSLHKYAYVHGDQIQGIDPTGMFFGSLIRLFSGVGRVLASRASLALRKSYPTGIDVLATGQAVTVGAFARGVVKTIAKRAATSAAITYVFQDRVEANLRSAIRELKVFATAPDPILDTVDMASSFYYLGEPVHSARQALLETVTFIENKLNEFTSFSRLGTAMVAAQGGTIISLLNVLDFGKFVYESFDAIQLTLNETVALVYRNAPPQGKALFIKHAYGVPNGKTSLSIDPRESDFLLLFALGSLEFDLDVRRIRLIVQQFTHGNFSGFALDYQAFLHGLTRLADVTYNGIELFAR